MRTYADIHQAMPDTPMQAKLTRAPGGAYRLSFSLGIHRVSVRGQRYADVQAQALRIVQALRQGLL